MILVRMAPGVSCLGQALDDFGSGAPVESRRDFESMFDRGVIPWPASEPELNDVHASGPGRKDLNRSDEAFIAAKGAAAPMARMQGDRALPGANHRGAEAGKGCADEVGDLSFGVVALLRRNCGKRNQVTHGRRVECLGMGKHLVLASDGEPISVERA